MRSRCLARRRPPVEMGTSKQRWRRKCSHWPYGTSAPVWFRSKVNNMAGRSALPCVQRAAGVWHGPRWRKSLRMEYMFPYWLVHRPTRPQATPCTRRACRAMLRQSVMSSRLTEDQTHWSNVTAVLNLAAESGQIFLYPAQVPHLTCRGIQRSRDPEISECAQVCH